MDIEVAGSADRKELNKKILEAADWMRGIWQQAVTGTILPGMTSPVFNQDYADSLERNQALHVEQHGEVLTARVVCSYPYWRQLEQPKEEDWKAILLDPARDNSGKLHTIPQKVNKKGKVTDPGGFSRVVPLGGYKSKEVARGIYSQVSVGEPLGEAWTNFDADAEPSSLSDPSRTATEVNPTISLPQPTSAENPRRMSSLTFRTVSTPRFDQNGRPLGSKPNSWMRKTPENPITRAVQDYCEPHIREYLRFP
jgi:hypothetical protein